MIPRPARVVSAQGWVQGHSPAWNGRVTSVSSTPEWPSKAVQLYDTPYEEQDAEPEDGATSGQSRMPLEDERPADEYDQPWEWKKDHISRAFAGVRKSRPFKALLPPLPQFLPEKMPFYPHPSLGSLEETWL